MRGIKTPYDFMKTKERKKLNGECVITNMYTDIITKEEFDLKDDKTKKAMLTFWRENYSNTKIMKGLGMTGQATFAKLLGQFDIPKKKTNVKKQKTTVVKKEVAPTPTPIKLISQGLNLEYNGEYTAEQLNKIFTKLQLLIDGEESKFILNVSLSERI